MILLGKGGQMQKVTYETENGVFEFNLLDVKDCLKANISKYDVEET